MKPKKTAKADLGNKRGIFFQIGLCVSLFATILFFMWSQPAISVDVPDVSPSIIDVIELVDITRQEPEPEKPKTVPVQTLIDIINIRPDNVKIDYTPDFSDAFDTPVVFVPANTGGTGKEEDVDIIDFMVIEDKPLFQGKDVNHFRSWVMKRLAYPQSALDNGVQGRVILQFVIDKDGSMSQISVLASPDRSLSEEAVRVLKSSEQWSPGKQRGRAVPVRFTIPVDFKLQ